MPENGNTPAEGSRACSGQCDACDSSNPCQTPQEREYRQMQARLRNRARQIRHEILVLSGKGGVGKSTISVSLAHALAREGHRVGLLDADLHGPSMPLMSGAVDERAVGTGESLEPVLLAPNLTGMSIAFLMPERTAPLIWRGPMKAKVLQQFVADVDWGPLDYLIVDLPPGTGDEPLTICQSFPEADGAIVVSTPQEASLSDCRRAVNFVRAVDVPVLGVIENMSGFVCPHCGEITYIFSTGGAESMAREMSTPFLGRLPLFAQVAEIVDQGYSLTSPHAPEGVREAFGAIVAEIVRLTEKTPAAEAAK